MTEPRRSRRITSEEGARTLSINTLISTGIALLTESGATHATRQQFLVDLVVDLLHDPQEEPGQALEDAVRNTIRDRWDVIGLAVELRETRDRLTALESMLEQAKARATGAQS